MTRNYFEYLLRELKWENTKKQKRYAKRIEKQSFKTLRKILTYFERSKYLRYNFLESLILAQDERWRRA